MADACEWIQSGREDIVVTGGCDSPIIPSMFGAWINLRVLSKNPDPARACRPFDRRRDGLVLADGAGMLVFEEAEHALRRGARIYAEILGSGSSSDATHITKPSPEGQASAIRHALRVSGLAAEDVDYINAHGTSTLLNDSTETQAIKLALGAHARRVGIELDQVRRRPLPGRQRRAGARRHHPRHPAPGHAPDGQPRGARPGVRPGLRPQRRAARAHPRRAQQLVRVWRIQRRSRRPSLRGMKPMDRPQIKAELEKILNIVDDQLLKRVQVQEETVIREGLGLDSLQIVELLFKIEERLNVKIADDEAPKLRTVGDLITLIDSKLNSGAKNAAK